MMFDPWVEDLIIWCGRERREGTDGEEGKKRKALPTSQEREWRRGNEIFLVSQPIKYPFPRNYHITLGLNVFNTAMILYPY